MKTNGFFSILVYYTAGHKFISPYYYLILGFIIYLEALEKASHCAGVVNPVTLGTHTSLSKNSGAPVKSLDPAYFHETLLLQLIVALLSAV